MSIKDEMDRVKLLRLDDVKPVPLLVWFEWYLRTCERPEFEIIEEPAWNRIRPLDEGDGQ